MSSKLENKYPHWILKVLGCLFWILLLFEQNLCWHVLITCLEVALPASLTFCLYGGFYLVIPNWYELFLFKVTALLLLPRTCVSKVNKITWFVHCSSEQQALQDPAAWGWRTPSWVSWPLGVVQVHQGEEHRDQSGLWDQPSKSAKSVHSGRTETPLPWPRNQLSLLYQRFCSTWRWPRPGMSAQSWLFPLS